MASSSHETWSGVCSRALDDANPFLRFDGGDLQGPRRGSVSEREVRDRLVVCEVAVSASTDVLRERPEGAMLADLDSKETPMTASGCCARSCLLGAFVLAACAASPLPRDSQTARGLTTSSVTSSEPSREVAIDTRPRPAATLRLEVVDANDAGRGAHLTTQLERFRRCIDRYRAPRGYAGGRFSVGGFIQPDGALTRGRVMALDYGEGFERCLEEDVAALTWPATGLDVMVGFSASILVHDISRRSPDEVRPTVHGAHHRPDAQPTRAPSLAWSEMASDSPSVEGFADELPGRSAVLSDCLWHAWPTTSPSTEAVVVVRVERSEIRATVRGEYEAPAPELVECLGRWLSVLSVPAGEGGVVTGRVTVGSGGGALSSGAL